MQRFFDSSSSDEEVHERLEMPLFQQLALRKLADAAQIAKMQQNVRSGRFTMEHYEQVWAPKLAHVGPQRQLPAAAAAAPPDAPAELSLFQKLELHGLAPSAQIAKMQQNVRSQAFTMEHYEAVWAPKLAQLGLGSPAPGIRTATTANTMSLFQKLELHALVSSEQIAKMRQNIRDGRFTVEHYEEVWGPKVTLAENQVLGRSRSRPAACPTSISAQIQQERARVLAAKSAELASAEELSASERELDAVEAEAEALAKSLLGRMPELVQAGLAGARQTAVWVGNIPESHNSDSALRDTLRKFGTIKTLFVRRKQHPSRSWSMVVYTTAVEAARAVGQRVAVRDDSDGSTVYLKLQTPDVARQLSKSQPGQLGKVISKALGQQQALLASSSSSSSSDSESDHAEGRRRAGRKPVEPMSHFEDRQAKARIAPRRRPQATLKDGRVVYQ